MVTCVSRSNLLQERQVGSLLCGIPIQLRWNSPAVLSMFLLSVGGSRKWSFLLLCQMSTLHVQLEENMDLWHCLSSYIINHGNSNGCFLVISTLFVQTLNKRVEVWWLIVMILLCLIILWRRLFCLIYHQSGGYSLGSVLIVYL